MTNTTTKITIMRSMARKSKKSSNRLSINLRQLPQRNFNHAHTIFKGDAQITLVDSCISTYLKFQILSAGSFCSLTAVSLARNAENSTTLLLNKSGRPSSQRPWCWQSNKKSSKANIRRQFLHLLLRNQVLQRQSKKRIKGKTWINLSRRWTRITKPQRRRPMTKMCPHLLNSLANLISRSCRVRNMTISRHLRSLLGSQKQCRNQLLQLL